MKGLRMTGSPTKAVIVTSASCGIGRAAALRLARDGFAVVANYAGNAAKAEGAVNEIMGQVLRANVGYA
jgi:3-oxoacyl-[acyl-carrier protein] reductase